MPIPGTPADDNPDCEKFYDELLKPARHHELLIEQLQNVADGKIKRLMVLMPPGSAKSSYASVAFPAWIMGRFKGKNVIMTTYGSDLAKKFGRKCRQIVKSELYKRVMGCDLRGDNAAADDWSLSNDSTYMSGGILSGITGNRADCLIIDDPFLGREQADSEVIRRKTLDEYQSSLKTRLKPDGIEIIINTRWHQGDLSGTILPDDYKGETGLIRAKDGAEWYVLCIQAQCTRTDDPLGRAVGEYLWTDWFPVGWWEQTKRTMSTPNARNWSALYQQLPTPDEGMIFYGDWFNLWPADKELPAFEAVYQSLDGAFSEKTTADFSCLLTFGLFRATEGSPRYSAMILDCYMEQVNYPSLRDEVIRQWGNKYGQSDKGVDGIIIEDKASGQALIPELRRAGMNIIGYQPGRLDKVARANLVSHLVRDGYLWVPESRKYKGYPMSWLDSWHDQMVYFPSAAHDDCVDATVQALATFDKMGWLKGKAAPEREVSYWRKLQQGNYSGG